MSEEVRNWKGTRLAFHVNGVLIPIVSLSWRADIPVTAIDTMQSARAGVYTGPMTFTINATIVQIGAEANDILHFALGKLFIELLLAVKEVQDDGTSEWSFSDISWTRVMVTSVAASGHMPGERPVIALTMQALRMKEGGEEYGDF